MQESTMREEVTVEEGSNGGEEMEWRKVQTDREMVRDTPPIKEGDNAEERESEGTRETTATTHQGVQEEAAGERVEGQQGHPKEEPQAGLKSASDSWMESR